MNDQQCDHGTDKVPVCSACFHNDIYDVCQKAGFPKTLSDYIANEALSSALNAGCFIDDED